MLPAHHVAERLQHQEHRTALISLDAGLVLGGDHLQGTVPVHRLVELAELAAPVDQQDVAGIAVLDLCRNGPVGRAAGIGALHTVYHNRRHSLLFHWMTSFIYHDPSAGTRERQAPALLLLSYDILEKITRSYG